MKKPPVPPQAIRPLYEAHGVEGYYREHGGDYQNPHLLQIRQLLERNLPRFDTTKVLDFAAGGGEVTRVLQDLGISSVTGCDPYTFALYERQTGRPCLRLSFKDVIRDGLPESYSTIVTSFALHLCPVRDLFALTWNLLLCAPALAVITPHKRPSPDQLPALHLEWEDAVVTDRGKKVRLQVYRRPTF